MEFDDIGSFSESGEFDGREWNIVVPCYLIRHPDGLLIWDTGMAASMLMPSANGEIRASVKQTLTAALKSLDVGVADVDFVAMSHLHPDHAGNANLFAGTATWLSNKSQFDSAFSNDGAAMGFDLDAYSDLESGDIELRDEHDVFGDGSVVILPTPGHTPGHQVLFVDLNGFGPIVLSGDLHILREGFEGHLVPSFNNDKSATLASMKWLDAFLKERGAKLIIQHSAADHAALPQAPAMLN